MLCFQCNLVLFIRLNNQNRISFYFVDIGDHMLILSTSLVLLRPVDSDWLHNKQAVMVADFSLRQLDLFCVQLLFF